MQAVELQAHHAAAAHVFIVSAARNSTGAQHLLAHRYSGSGANDLSSRSIAIDAPGGVTLRSTQTPCGFAYTHNALPEDADGTVGSRVATYVRFDEPGAQHAAAGGI